MMEHKETDGESHFRLADACRMAGAGDMKRTKGIGGNSYATVMVRAT